MNITTHTTPEEREDLREKLSYLCWAVQALAEHAALTRPHLAAGSVDSMNDVADLLFAALHREECAEHRTARRQGGASHAC